MTSQTLWAGLSVQDFFQGYNWTGESPTLEPTVTDETADVPSLLCLKVQDFLGQANWRGEVITSKAPSPAQPLRPAAEFSLTLPVAEFMGFINWRGNRNVGSVIAPETVKKVPSFARPSSEIDLDHLSDLF
ncbi:MAG: hypothetical protein ACKO4S_05850 [Snowella sp.]